MNTTFTLSPAEDSVAFFGTTDRHLRMLREAFEIRLSARHQTLRLTGPVLGVQRATSVLEAMRRLLRVDGRLSQSQVAGLIHQAQAAAAASPSRGVDSVALPMRTAAVAPKSEGQAGYLDTIRAHDITFCVGPAGTGKTFLAVAQAVEALRAGSCRRIVLARPAVEAGEKLGFLPGDLQEKVNPYLRPLIDALETLLDNAETRRLMTRGIVEIVPLAFMRGRTLDRSFVILDEAQNCTVPQMKMFLTRLGAESKAVVTGDPTQTDLVHGEISGLHHACEILRGIRGIGFTVLANVDVVRHPLVREIINAYEGVEKPA